MGVLVYRKAYSLLILLVANLPDKVVGLPGAQVFDSLDDIISKPASARRDRVLCAAEDPLTSFRSLRRALLDNNRRL